MASRSFIRSTITSTYPKYADFLVGNEAYDPAAFVSIATVTAAGGETSLSFTSIPGTYVSLQIRGIVRNGTGTLNDSVSMYFRLNSDTGSNYAWHSLYGTGASAGASSGTTATSMRFPELVGAGVLANTFCAAVIDIHDYASTAKNKTVRMLNGWDANGLGYVIMSSGLWMSTSAVTSVSLIAPTGTFAAGSTFALYGIKGA